MSDIEARARAYFKTDKLDAEDAAGLHETYREIARAEVELERKRIFPLVRELALRAYERGRFKEASFFCKNPDNLEPFDIWLTDEFKEIIKGEP